MPMAKHFTYLTALGRHKREPGGPCSREEQRKHPRAKKQRGELRHCTLGAAEVHRRP